MTTEIHIGISDFFVYHSPWYNKLKLRSFSNLLRRLIIPLLLETVVEFVSELITRQFVISFQFIYLRL